MESFGVCRTTVGSAQAPSSIHNWIPAEESGLNHTSRFAGQAMATPDGVVDYVAERMNCDTTCMTLRLSELIW